MLRASEVWGRGEVEGHGDKVALAYDPRGVELGRVALREQVWGRSGGSEQQEACERACSARAAEGFMLVNRRQHCLQIPIYNER